MGAITGKLHPLFRAGIELRSISSHHKSFGGPNLKDDSFDSVEAVVSEEPRLGPVALRSF